MALDLDASIAELERYGLSFRVISLVEENLGVLYIHQLQEWTAEAILTRGLLGPDSVRSLIAALKRMDAGQPMYTDQELVFGVNDG